MTITAHLDSQREQKNIDLLYEERGLAIAKTIDVSIKSEAQLQTDAQKIVDSLTASGLGVTELTIHAKAPAGQSESGYWVLASNDKSIINQSSEPDDLEAILTGKSGTIEIFEDGKPIIDIAYPLHDTNGNVIAAAGLEFDMSGLQSQINTSKILLISLIMTLVAIIATFVFAKSITKPITKLRDIADKVSMGDFQQKVTTNSDDEVSELGQSFQRMINAFKISQAMSQEGVKI
jgi:HAMP domain-containing protein